MFVIFKARGVIFERDKNGEATKKVKAVRYGSGVVKTGADLYGKVFRQCRNLVPCDSVTVKTYNI